MASNSEKIGEASSSVVAASSVATTTEAVAGAGAGARVVVVVGADANNNNNTNKSERVKATRHPRWTRQETIVLIEAKKMVENGDHQQPRFKSPNGLYNQTDLKWDMVASLCQNQGVKRGPVQCRKRWGNLLTDFRKIKKWEASVRENNNNNNNEVDSFWMMRNDRRKENKLPGFFDEVVYRFLDGGNSSSGGSGVLCPNAYPLTLVKMPPRPTTINPPPHHGLQGVDLLFDDDDEEEDDEDDQLLDDIDEVEGDDGDEKKSSWSNEEDVKNMFFESSTSKNNVFITPTTYANKQSAAMRGNLKITPPLLALPTPPPPGFESREPAVPQEGHKRRRAASEIGEQSSNPKSSIMKLMRRNTNIMKAYLGAQNMHHQLAREQQKEQTESIVAALGKLTDAVNKIAEKL